MPNNPLAHHRKSIRLKGYDYTCPGAYFVTIVTHRRACVFGEIAGGVMRLNEWGEIARLEWVETAAIRREIELDEFVIMPNHIHGIVIIMECENGLVGATGRSPLRSTMPCGPANKSLASLIAGYKSAVTTHINAIRATPGAPVWQRNYWEHIIRDDGDLSHIRDYIHNNPVQWETDVENGGDPA